MLWIGLLLLIAGAVSMGVALAAGFDPTDASSWSDGEPTP